MKIRCVSVISLITKGMGTVNTSIPVKKPKAVEWSNRGILAWAYKSDPTPC